MSDLGETNPHLALWQSENYVSPGEQAWLRWVKKVERLLGHELDGNQDRDGYSLDFAYDCWKHGDTPEAYVKEVADAKAALARKADYHADRFFAAESLHGGRS